MENIFNPSLNRIMGERKSLAERLSRKSQLSHTVYQKASKRSGSTKDNRDLQPVTTNKNNDKNANSIVKEVVKKNSKKDATVTEVKE